VDAPTDPLPYSRKWFGDIFLVCWGFSLGLSMVRWIVGWDSHGVVYWLFEGPLLAGVVLGGVPWLVLAIRDGSRNRRLVWIEARRWLVIVAAISAIVYSGYGIASLGS
jgi:hypothetical protein